MYKLGKSVGNTIPLIALRFHFITSTTLKNFNLVFTYTKNVRDPWLNKANFEKSIKSC